MSRTLIDYLQNPGTDAQVLGDSIVSLIQDADFVEIAASFRSSLFSERGTMPNYVTASIADPALPTTVDCFGMLKTCNAGEALFYGARRVENLLKYSEHLSTPDDNSWFFANGSTITPVTNPKRFGKSGDMTAWKLSRAATVNSVIRTGRPLRYHHGIAGLDLLLPVPHFAGINMRKSTTNVVSTAEPRIYTSGGNTHATNIMTITDQMQTYGLTFTPTAAKAMTALSWSSGTLTVTCAGHGYTTGLNVRLSGSMPVGFDINGAVATVPDANTFTIAMPVNPGSLVSAGWTQMQYVFGIAPGSWSSNALGDIEIEKPYVSEMLGYSSGFVPEYVPRNRIPQRKYWYGAAVDGVKYFDTEPAWSHNATTGLVTEGIGPALSTCRGITTYAHTINSIQRRFAEAFSGWGKADASMAVSDAALACPTGAVEASRITEGTHTGRHYLELPAGQLTTSNIASGLVSSITCYLATPGGSAGRDWAVLSFTDLAGVEQHGYFDLANGVTGSKTFGFQFLNIEALGTLGGLKYYRAHVSVLHATGSTTPLLRIGLAAANGSNTYAGGGTRYIAAWGASFAGGTSNRPVAAPYGRRNWADTATLAGAAVSFTAGGLLNLSNISAASKYTPYYNFFQPGRVSWTGSIYFRCEPVQSISSATTASPSQVFLDRFGIVIRPNLGTSSSPNHLTKVAFDHYNGEVIKHYLFEAGKSYAVGDIVVPSDTYPNNANSRKMWTVTAAGVSSTEPAWPAVSSVPSATVTSGSVTFQVTHDNGIVGSFEPYDGAQIQPPSGFMPQMSAAFAFSPQSYTAFFNGSEADKQTLPQPINPDIGYALRSPVSTIVLGGLGSDDVIDATTVSPYASATLTGLMPVHTAFHKDVVVWNATKTPAYLAALTGGL